jgi:hypothetical protein
MQGSWERSCLRRDRQSVRHGPSRAQRLRRVFCCPTHGSFDDVPAQAGTGDPDPGARAAFARAQARGACRRERGDEPDTDGRANSSEFAHCGATQSAAQIYFVIWFAAGIINACGSTDAGGEDVGYFASWKKRVRHPPLTSRTVEVPRQGSPRATAQVLPKGSLC